MGAKRGQAMGLRRKYGNKAQDESLSVEKLRPKHRYRVLLLNEREDERVRFSLRIEIIERPKAVGVPRAAES